MAVVPSTATVTSASMDKNAVARSETESVLLNREFEQTLSKKPSTVGSTPSTTIHGSLQFIDFNQSQRQQLAFGDGAEGTANHASRTVVIPAKHAIHNESLDVMQTPEVVEKTRASCHLKDDGSPVSIVPSTSVPLNTAVASGVYEHLRQGNHMLHISSCTN